MGQFHVFRQTQADLENAIGYLNQAIEISAELAEAYSTLGWAYSFLGTGYGAQSPDESIAGRSRGMIFSKVNEYLRDYRDDPRYLDLVRRVGLWEKCQ